MICLVSELVTLCSCLLLTQGCCYLISQESERGGEICEGLLAELQGNILSSLLGSLLLFVGWHTGNLSQKQVPSSTSGEDENLNCIVRAPLPPQMLVMI